MGNLRSSKRKIEKNPLQVWRAKNKDSKTQKNEDKSRQDEIKTSKANFDIRSG